MISVLHIFDMFSINRFTRPQGKLFGLLLTFHLADRYVIWKSELFTRYISLLQNTFLPIFSFRVLSGSFLLHSFFGRSSDVLRTFFGPREWSLSEERPKPNRFW